MSIAWTTVALLVTLFPGVTFFWGAFSSERFTRQTSDRGALTNLAFVVLISFFVHIPFLMFLKLPCMGVEAICVDWGRMLAIFQLEGAGTYGLADLGRTLSSDLIQVFFYVTLSSGLGYGYGRGAGALVSRGWFRNLSPHPWAQELLPAEEKVVTFAYVLTNIREGNRILLYRGFLDDFALDREGQISYLVLRSTERVYMELQKDEAVVKRDPHLIGSSANTGALEPAETESRIFLIEGEDIENVVFDRVRFEPTAKGLRLLNRELDRKEERESPSETS